jgi:hypothetical protein
LAPSHDRKERHIATQDTYTSDAHPSGQALTDARVASGVGILERWRERSAERKRRTIVNWLRVIAKQAADRDPIRRRHDVLLHYRAAAVRTELLEIAALLERAHDPDPDCVAALHALLAHTRPSPLYNPNIPFPELQATLDHVRAGL